MIFWVLAALMTAAAMVLVVRPLSKTHKAALSAFQKAAVYKDQWAEIARDRAGGALNDTQAEVVRDEVGRRLLTAAYAAEDDVWNTRSSPGIAFGLTCVVPLLALVVYLFLGNPELPDLPFAGRGHAEPPPAVLDALKRLVHRLQAQPNDVQGWALLGETYKALQRYPEAVEAWRHVTARESERSEFQAAFGEALVLANAGVVTEEARQAFTLALQQAPHNPLAQHYLAIAHMQAGDLQGALDRWKAMLQNAPADAPWLPEVYRYIGLVASQVGQDPAFLISTPRTSQPSE